MSLTIANVVWGIICFLGVVDFFAGNGGPASIAISMPLIFSAVTYYIALNHFMAGLLASTLIGLVVLVALFMLLASRIKPKEPVDAE